MSNLNNDIFNRHLQAHHSCSCGHPRETVEHYLLHCNNYANVRNNTIYTLPSNWTDSRTLLCGNPLIRFLDHQCVSINSLTSPSVFEAMWCKNLVRYSVCYKNLSEPYISSLNILFEYRIALLRYCCCPPPLPLLSFSSPHEL